MKKYDLVVIGSGPGGYIAAEQAAKSGLKTLCIESNDFGGVCLNKGCIPTKALLNSAKIHQYVLKAADYGIQGINTNSITLDWSKIIARKNDVVKKLQMGVQGLLKKAKAETIKGLAKIVDANTVSVNDELINFDNLIIATGSSPRKFNLPGFDIGYSEGKILTSDEVLNLPNIPSKFTVIGGGVIGVEFAILFAELGSQVTILQGVDRILEVLDKDVSTEVSKLLTNKGIKIVTNAQIKKYENGKVYYDLNNQEFTEEFEYCLVSVGRAPSTDIVKPLGLELARNGSIITNDYMQTSLKHIYAIGDCTSKVMLAHSAYKNAVVAVNNILNKPTKMDILKVPGCIYTHPQVATVGYTEEQLKELNIPYFAAKYQFSHLGKALADGTTFGFIKLLVSQDCGEILGCHIVGEESSDYISEIALAMETEATVYTISQTIHPHPTYSEIVWEVARKIVLENFKDKVWE
ncbi:MAG: dihydrolipoyl dehydrogenase [Malacoplasma sp.]|nr:dihydrolipoyl dehydrogenase [Malacoplasma sp.]